MAFVLNSLITITERLDTASPANAKPKTLTLRGCNEVVIKKSINSIVQECEIRLPIHFKIRQEGKYVTGTMEDLKKFETLFKRGSKVVVQLGYNKQYLKEFEGFIHRVDEGFPLTIYCDGYAYQLDNILQNKWFINTDFKEVLKYIIAGTDIVLAPELNDISFKIDNLHVTNELARTFLAKFSEQYLLSAFFKDNVLYAGLQYGHYFNTVNYRLGWNTIKNDELKLHEAEDTTVKINIVGGGRQKGKQVKYSAGDNTTNIKKVRLSDVTDEGAIKRYADKWLRDKKFNGYQGTITTFGKPFIQHGDAAIVEDLRYTERSGTYIVDTIETRFNTRGFRRNVGLSFLVGKQSN